MYDSGRYHAKGAFRAVYLASNHDLAHWEYFHTLRNRQTDANDLLPLTLLAVDVTLMRVLDLTRPDVCHAIGTTPSLLATYDWGAASGEPLTHQIGRLAQAAGLDALLFPSAAVATSPAVDGFNIVAFPDNIAGNTAGNIFKVRNSDKLPPPPPRIP